MATIDNDGMTQTLNYLYGFKSVGNQHLYFINNNDIYLGKSSTESEKINCNLEEQKCKDIKDFFIHNINVIYNNDYNNNTAKYNDHLPNSKLIKKKRKTGGDPTYTFKLPNNDDAQTNAYENLYKRLNDEENDRSIFTTTREPEHVNLLVLCYFHINDFDMTIPCKFSELNPKITEKIKKFNKNYYQIISEQEALHEIEFNETVKKIQENKPIHPVNIDVERDYDGNNKFYLSDGNHRIAALKDLGYQGYVSAYVCSYIPEFKIKSYLIPSNDCVCEVGVKRKAGNKPRVRRILKSYSYS